MSYLVPHPNQGIEMTECQSDMIFLLISLFTWPRAPHVLVKKSAPPYAFVSRVCQLPLGIWRLPTRI